MYSSVREFISESLATPPHGSVADAVVLVGIALCGCNILSAYKSHTRFCRKMVARSSTTWDDDLLNPSFYAR